MTAMRWVSVMTLLGSAAALVGCSGEDGKSCTVRSNADGSTTIACDDGTTATVEGPSAGASCTVEDNGDGSKTISCDDGTTATVRDGEPGDPGDPGDPGQPGDPGDPGDPGAPGRDLTVPTTGLKMEVREVGIDADQRPFAVLRFTDSGDRPLDRDGAAITAGFTVAYLPVVDGVTQPYVNYLARDVTSMATGNTASQPTADSMGTWTAVDASDGVYRYAFGATLPADYDMARTHTIGIYASRVVDGVTYVANASPNFRPDGMAVTETRDIVSLDGCHNCHNDLALHGGRRRDPRLCATCHADGYADPDTGNSIDFRVMIHRIHRGHELPSVVAGTPYTIVGFRDTEHDYSDVAFPRDIRSCDTCHTGTDGQRWNTNPSRAACGSCHDDISFEATVPPGMVPHPGGDRPTDAECTTCHEPTEPALSPIVEAHFTKYSNPESPTVEALITAVTNTGPTERPVIDLQILVDGVGRDILAMPLGRFGINVAGPTTDYRFATSFNPTMVGTLAPINAAMGQFRYTLPSTVNEIATTAGYPEAARGSWAFSVEAYVTVGTDRFPAVNPVFYARVTDTTVVPRRHVVDISRCNGCHEHLELHGNNRTNTDACVMCHNPNLDTGTRMPAPAAGETVRTYSMYFPNLIHRIHGNAIADQPFFGFSPSGAAADFTDIAFPGDPRDCGTCHEDDTFALPLSGERLPSRTRLIDSTRATVETFLEQPTSAACTGCHDSPDAQAHAEIMTTATGAESCATCHAAGRAYGIDVAHARPEFE